MANPQQSFRSIELTPSTLLHSRRRAVSRTTLLYQLDVLKQTGRYDAFKLQWHSSYSDEPETWPIPKHLFWDSDIGKWIEGACYFLMSKEASSLDSSIQTAVDELVDMIASAQQPDGYLNIHYTVVAPDLRFTNLRDMHELYNCGHLIEAALAHDDMVRPKASSLLTTMVKYVDLLCTLFGPLPHQMHGYPGHPEIELALIRLFKRTQDPKHADLARYFLTERGNPTGSLGQHYYITEAARRGEDPHASPSFMGEHNTFWYQQAHLPISQQTEIKGHSVRAMYLLTAAADLCLLQPDQKSTKDLLPAIRTLWNDMVQRKMYVTGGIGAIKQWEGFGLRYFLPQSTDEGGCYAETCASIGIMMLAERLLQLELDGSVADIMEVALYNTVLSGMSADGKKFTYVNQLASSEGNLALKEEWFTCACCPPNVLRCLGMLGGYIYTFHDDKNTLANGTAEAQQDIEEATIDVHLFVSSTGSWKLGENTVELKQQSDYPWSGKIDFSSNTKSTKVGINIRIPAWSQNNWRLFPSPTTISSLRNGYVHLPPTYLTTNPNFTLNLSLTPRLLSPHPLSNQAHTLVVARGPLVYCVEDADNDALGVPSHDHYRGLHLDAGKVLEGLSERVVGAGGDEEDGEKYVEITLTKGVWWVDLGKNGEDVGDGGADGPCYESATADSSTRNQAKEIEKLVMIPFYNRANRKESGGVSRVGLRRWYGM